MKPTKMKKTTERTTRLRAIREFFATPAQPTYGANQLASFLPSNVIEELVDEHGSDVPRAVVAAALTFEVSPTDVGEAAGDIRDDLRLLEISVALPRWQVDALTAAAGGRESVSAVLAEELLAHIGGLGPSKELHRRLPDYDGTKTQSGVPFGVPQ